MRTEEFEAALDALTAYAETLGLEVQLVASFTNRTAEIIVYARPAPQIARD